MSRQLHTALLCFCALACAGLGLMPVRAEELRYKFQPGSKTNYAVEQKQNMKMSAMGQDLDMKNNMTMDVSMAVDAVDTATGNATVKYKVDRVQMNMEGGPFGKSDFDSKSDKEPEGPLAMAAPIFKALTADAVTMTVSPRGEISNVKLPEKLKEAFQNAAGNFGGGPSFSEDQLKQMMNNGVFVLPKEAPTTSTTWSHPMEMKMGPIGTMKTNTKYTYAGKSGNFDKINLAIDMKLESSPDSPMQIKMNTKEASGTILFDNAKGRVQEMTTKTVSDMELGQVGTMNMTQNTVMKVKE
jgi:hypothetical protein